MIRHNFDLDSHIHVPPSCIEVVQIKSCTIFSCKRTLFSIQEQLCYYTHADDKVKKIMALLLIVYQHFINILT